MAFIANSSHCKNINLLKFSFSIYADSSYRSWETQPSDEVKNVLLKIMSIGHVNKIPTMQFFTEISRNTQSKSYIRLSLTECVWEFRNNALWDTHKHCPIVSPLCHSIFYRSLQKSMILSIQKLVK